MDMIAEALHLLLIKAEPKGTPADNNKNIRFCLLTFKWPHLSEGAN